MNRMGRQGGASYQRVAARTDRIALDVVSIFIGKAVVRGQMVGAFLETEKECAFGRAQPCRRLHQRVEHGLQIEGRAADDLEHFRR